MVKRTTIYEASDGTQHASSVEAQMHEDALQLVDVFTKSIVKDETGEVDAISSIKNLMKTHNIRKRTKRKPKAMTAGKNSAPAKKKAA